MDRVDNQAGDKVPAARTARRPDRMARVVDAAVEVLVRVKAKAKVVVADRERAAARDGVAVNIVQVKLNPYKEDTIMPRLDRSGPRGAGPMTGGRRGLCMNTGSHAHLTPCGGGYGYSRKMGFRRGLGRGRGRGFGPADRGYPYPQLHGSSYPVSRSDEMEMLRADADAMQKSLDAVQRRITELEKEESQ